jgi:predicted metal-binding membrane protein
MMQVQLQREQMLFLALLLILAAVSWALLIWLSRTAQTMGMGLTMGKGIGWFLAIWVVMMVAMMVPATAPMNLAFARVQRERRTGGHAFGPPWIFVGAYLLIWTLSGGLAYLGANAASELARTVPWLMLNATWIVGGLLILAGLYQFTPLKRVCLANCCQPQQFLYERWHDGHVGAFRLGLKHGLSCLGANGVLCVLLFPLGLMNLAAMAVLTVVICTEKVLPQAQRIAQVAGLVLILYGTLVILVPSALLLNGAEMEGELLEAASIGREIKNTAAVG